MEKVQKIHKKNGITLIYDEKFNEVVMSLRIMFPLKKETATIANIMANLFSDRLVHASTKAALLAKKDNLYGVKVSASSYSIGQYHSIEINLKGIHQDFVKEPLHQMYYEFLMEFLKTPLIDEKTLKEAKKNVKQTLLRLDETPSHKALFSAFEYAGKDQTFGVNVYGYLDDIDAITIDEVKVFHQQCVSEFEKELYIVGRIQEEDFNFSDKFTTQDTPAFHKTYIENETIKETYKGNQSEIVLVYETEINPNHPSYYPYLMLLAVLGQSPNSLLFQNIREKESLCYSIYASQLIFDGIFYIGTSINPENEERVLKLVDEQFEIIREGNFDLEASRNYLINRLNGTTENTRQLLDFTVRNQRMGLSDSIEDVIEKFRHVTKEEVIRALDEIKTHLTYIYEGVTHENNQQ